MNELLSLLATSLAFLLEPGRYRIVDSSASRSFGDASVTLQSEALRLQLVRDRSQVSLRLQPVAERPDEWYWIGVARRLLDGDRPGSDDLDEGAATFLRGALPGLEARCASDEARWELVSELRRAKEDRATEMWGPLPPPRT